MKRIASLLLLALLLFNWFGYRLLLSFMEDKADMQLEAQLDQDQYDQSQLVSIKIPVKYISYYSGSTTFERVDGEITSSMASPGNMSNEGYSTTPLRSCVFPTIWP